MSVYLRAKFEASSIILPSFRRGVILAPLPPQNEPLKSPPRLGLKSSNYVTRNIIFLSLKQDIFFKNSSRQLLLNEINLIIT